MSIAATAVRLATLQPDDVTDDATHLESGSVLI